MFKKCFYLLHWTTAQRWKLKDEISTKKCLSSFKCSPHPLSHFSKETCKHQTNSFFCCFLQCSQQFTPNLNKKVIYSQNLGRDEKCSVESVDMSMAALFSGWHDDCKIKLYVHSHEKMYSINVINLCVIIPLLVYYIQSHFCYK